MLTCPLSVVHFSRSCESGLKLPPRETSSTSVTSNGENRFCSRNNNSLCVKFSENRESRWITNFERPVNLKGHIRQTWTNSDAHVSHRLRSAESPVLLQDDPGIGFHKRTPLNKNNPLKNKHEPPYFYVWVPSG